jgi:6-phospho-beta-glucosidase
LSVLSLKSCKTANRRRCEPSRASRSGSTKLDITDKDQEQLEHTVDFVSFSYYMSICETADPAHKFKGGATSSGGCPIRP